MVRYCYGVEMSYLGFQEVCLTTWGCKNRVDSGRASFVGRYFFLAWCTRYDVDELCGSDEVGYVACLVVKVAVGVNSDDGRGIWIIVLRCKGCKVRP